MNSRIRLVTNGYGFHNILFQLKNKEFFRSSFTELENKGVNISLRILYFIS